MFAIKLVKEVENQRQIPEKKSSKLGKVSSDLKTIQDNRLLIQLAILKDIYYTRVRFCCIHIYV